MTFIARYNKKGGGRHAAWLVLNWLEVLTYVLLKDVHFNKVTFVLNKLSKNQWMAAWNDLSHTAVVIVVEQELCRWLVCAAL